jgi:hypothetical protein
VKAIIGAAIAIIAVAAPAIGLPAGANASPSGCTATSGVTVIVDFTHFPGGKVERGCAPGQPANGLIALHQAGFTSAGTAQYGDAFVCRIDGLPSPNQEACAVTPAPTAYWAYWNARPTDTKWTYGSLGVLDYRPRAGTIEAFAFGSHAEPSVSPRAAIPPTTTTTTRRTTTTRAPPATSPPPVTAATLPTTPAPTGAPAATIRPTTTTVRATSTSKPKSTTTSTRAPTTTRGSTATSSTVGIVDRSASGPAKPHESSGSPLGVILAIVIVGGLGSGAFAFTRARRHRPA